MIDWKSRFKNKTFLITFTTAIIAFIYQMLSMFELVPQVSQDTVGQLVGLIVNILVGLGIVVNPTTSGISD
jgi:phi LC3 family holin